MLIAGARLPRPAGGRANLGASASRALPELFNPQYAAVIGAVLNTVWIFTMNAVYLLLAQKLNDLENHRTDSEHEDALILKTFLFQFCNSYGALFYIAFIKVAGDGCLSADD